MPPTEKALAEQFRRCEVVARAKALQAAGLSQSQAARELGVAPATLSRWLRAHARGGDAALLPRTQRCGRKALAVEATEEDRRQLKRLRLATGSDALALQMWADDARCSEGLRAAILKPRASRHNLPASLRQLCHVTAEEAALFRGHRTFELAGFIQRRDDTKVLADGRRVPLEPGDLWELDDMSLNQPFWWESEARGDGDALSRRQGAAVGRQVLFAQDVASGRWLGFELVGRPRDAYRAADILRFIRRLIEQHGMPRIGFRLEGGIWRARAIAGITLDERGNTAQRPAMADEQRQALFGGLQELGLTVDWCHSPHHKGGIESGFNYLQSVLAAVSVMEGAYVVDLGRHRGE
ncbi:MAG: helix-turn-helix domain-containing protein, partial [Verrucomicrobia bacterium]